MNKNIIGTQEMCEWLKIKSITDFNDKYNKCKLPLTLRNIFKTKSILTFPRIQGHSQWILHRAMTPKYDLSKMLIAKKSYLLTYEASPRRVNQKFRNTKINL